MLTLERVGTFPSKTRLNWR